MMVKCPPYVLLRLERRRFYWLTVLVATILVSTIVYNWHDPMHVKPLVDSKPPAHSSDPHLGHPPGKPSEHATTASSYRGDDASHSRDTPLGGDILDAEEREVEQLPGEQQDQENGGTRLDIIPGDPEQLPENQIEVKEKTTTASRILHREDTNIVWVGGNGSLVERVQDYVKAISDERAKLLRRQSLNVTKWVPPAGPIIAVWGNDVDTIYKLQNHSIVRTVALEWLGAADDVVWSSLKDHHNLVVQDYYEWSGTEVLCSWIQTQGHTKARWDAAYNCTCNTDPTLSYKPKSLEEIYLHSKPINPSHYWPNGGTRYPEHYYTEVPKYVYYMHIVQDAVIDGVGDVISHDLKIVPYTCSHNPSPTPPSGFMDTPVYNEVFIITQFWGEAFFHKMTESIPRIAPYLQFLKLNQNMLIHVAESRGLTAKIMKLLGVDPWRLISGVCRAKVVYLPQGTYCGFPHVQEMQLLSHIYRGIISETFPQTERNTVLVIRRTGTRKFSQYQEIEDIVKTLSDQYGFRFELYRDNPMPSFEEAMQMFNRAVMVVGPHGAGLSNLVFSQPGTVVIEGVCNPPHVNMCYQRTAHILGHRYHGVPSLGGWTAIQGGCETVVDINPPIIGEVVEAHMKLLRDSSV